MRDKKRLRGKNKQGAVSSSLYNSIVYRFCGNDQSVQVSAIAKRSPMLHRTHEKMCAKQSIVVRLKRSKVYTTWPKMAHDKADAMDDFGNKFRRHSLPQIRKTLSQVLFLKYGVVFFYCFLWILLNIPLRGIRVNTIAVLNFSLVPFS